MIRRRHQIGYSNGTLFSSEKEFARQTNGTGQHFYSTYMMFLGTLWSMYWNPILRFHIHDRLILLWLRFCLTNVWRILFLSRLERRKRECEFVFDGSTSKIKFLFVNWTNQFEKGQRNNWNKKVVSLSVQTLAKLVRYLFRNLRKRFSILFRVSSQMFHKVWVEMDQLKELWPMRLLVLVKVWKLVSI